MKTVNHQDYSASVQGDNGISVVKFWASWCPPCKALDPKIAELELSADPSVRFFSYQVDASDEDVTYAKKLRVSTVPTVFVINHHNNQRISIGNDIKKISETIEKFLKEQ